MTTGDGRRTSTGTFWGTETSGLFDSFSNTILLNGDLPTVRLTLELGLANYALASKI